MSDEELEQVAGGSWKSTAGDTRFLNDLAGLCDRFGATSGFFKFGTVSDEACKGWSEIGIQVNPAWFGSNTYHLNGNPITRQEAMEYALKKFGKTWKDMPEGKGGYTF
ncbi:MAG: hypothetical protein SR2Q5_07775 [Quinella sp. 2Q5]|nr:hypothetical protein [Quinella sp. 2Q5]